MEYKSSREIKEEQLINNDISKYVANQQLMDRNENRRRSIMEEYDKKLTQEHLENYDYPKLEDFPEYNMLLDSIEKLRFLKENNEPYEDVVNKINSYIEIINNKNLWTKDSLEYVQKKMLLAVATKTR